MRALVLRIAVLLLAAGGPSACTGGAGDPARDQLTDRERDSIIAGSRLPGAAAVGRALRVSDSIASRNALLDSAGVD